VEDDGITTESMFKVVDGDTGEKIDVRELLGITEEDLKNNPDLLNILKHMNEKSPLQEPQDSSSGSEQKQRHFKNYDMLKKSVQGDEFMAKPDFDGGAGTLTWQQWYE
jgi:hypothetical protein